MGKMDGRKTADQSDSDVLAMTAIATLPDFTYRVSQNEEVERHLASFEKPSTKILLDIK